MGYQLSILIPALREEFLKETVENILAQKRGATEVIVGLDGEWGVVGKELEQHPDVRVIYSSKNLGQRAMTNLLAKLSEAKYVAKADAHTCYDEGFDVKLMDALAGHDDWTIVPAMKNLHVFSWVCSNCGTEFYQGEKPAKCPDELCQFIDTTFDKKIYFVPRGEMGSNKSRGPVSTAYRFTPDRLQFKYFGALKGYQDKEGDVAETMSLQGSFFMLTRDKYWELNICDESWGGWGQQGTEVALKTWLSGGRVVCHRGTWYAHMFRTNDQVAFPWNSAKVTESQGRQQDRSRKACIDLFKNNKWDKQTRGLSWLIERFWEPLQLENSDTDSNDRKWTQEDIAELKKTEARFNVGGGSADVTKGIIYFTDGELPERIAKPCLDAIQKIATDKGMPLVDSRMIEGETRGYHTMFKQILRGLQQLDTDFVFMAEHDVLYPPEHFDFTPPDKRFWYDQNWWKVHSDGQALHWDADQVSGLVADRQELINYYQYRVDSFDKDNFDRKFEPFSGEGSASWKAPVPHIDIRHDHNLTYNKRGLHHFRNKSTAVNFTETTIDKIPGWDNIRVY